MTTFARRITTLCALLLQVSISTVARAQEYTITDLGDLAPLAINESGVIVGYAPLSGGATAFRAFVWEAGILTLLPTHVAIARSFPQEAQAAGNPAKTSNRQLPTATFFSPGRLASPRCRRSRLRDRLGRRR